MSAMNNYFTLIYLAKELKATLEGAQFIQAVTYKKHIIELFFSREEQLLKLNFAAQPARTACFTDPRTTWKKSNAASFFQQLEGAVAEDITLTEGDRYLQIMFDDAGYRLVFKMFSGKPNVFLVKDGKIEAAFKNPDLFKNKPAPEPRVPNPKKFEESSGPLKKRIQQAFPLFPRNFIDDVIHTHQLTQKPDQEVSDVFGKAQKQLSEKPEPALLPDGRFTILSDEFTGAENAERFDSVNDAIRVAWYSESKVLRFSDRHKKLMSAVENRLEKLKSQIEDAGKSEKSLERAERYEQLGHILVAYAHTDAEGSEVISLPDFYNNSELVEIKLDPRLDLAANANRYFEKKKKSERSFESAQAYAQQVEERIAKLEEIHSKLSEAETMQDLDEAEQQFKEAEPGGRSAGADSDQKPYRVVEAGKYEVWIGKNAKSNDALLRDAHKEDIWLHARGVSGSHVLIRMNKVTADPDMRFLEKVASWAAWHSKGKGAGLCPVIWTRKKFVRKPKGAPAGAVVTDREQVVMAEPQPLEKTSGQHV